MWNQALTAAIGQGWPANTAQYPRKGQFHRLLETLPAGAYTCDSEGLITYFNPHAEQLWGRGPALNDPVDRFCGSFKLFAMDGTPIPHDQCWMALALKHNTEYNGQEIVIERPDGQRVIVLAYANPIHDESGQLLGAVNVLVDITARKHMEMALQESEARLKVALQEKELLLKELHHRVKNNLQVICSLLRLQRDTLDDAMLRELFRESEQRIRSMALIHETLYQAHNMAQFHPADYLRTLGDELFRAYGVDPQRITLTSRIDDVVLPLDAAMPCGLILNELLSNALKHAFPAGQSGDVRIEFYGGADQQAILRVIDTGVGFPEGLDLYQADSLGLQLVCALAEQLQGTISLERQGGTTVTLTFPRRAT